MPSPTDDPADRYDRQQRLPQIRSAGQARLGAATVVVLGCGALGTVSAEALCRAGVGTLVLVDRDVVDRSNLQRQTLYTDADARVGRPKAVAAARRLARVNPHVRLRPVPADFTPANAHDLLGDADLVVDGTDNAGTRYLLNDLCVSQNVPWVYGACVGTQGRVATFDPHVGGPCLRCVFRDPPAAGELPTCDTAGVLGPAAGVVANLQAASALRLLVGGGTSGILTTVDAWECSFRTLHLSRDPACPCCVGRRFDFLNTPRRQTVTLCGRDAVQVRPAGGAGVDLNIVARRLDARDTRLTPYMLRFVTGAGETATLFPDGRLLVQGTTDPARARSIYARFVGS